MQLELSVIEMILRGKVIEKKFFDLKNKPNLDNYFANQRSIAGNLGSCVKDGANKQIKHNTKRTKPKN